MSSAFSNKASSFESPSKMRKIKKVKVQHNDSSHLQISFVTTPFVSRRPMCLVCCAVLSDERMKPIRLKDHFKRLLPNKIGNDFKRLRNKKATYTQSLFAKTNMRREDIPTAPYNISLLIGKTVSRTLFDKILGYQPQKKSLRRLSNKVPHQCFGAVPLSNDTVLRHVEEMSDDVLKQFAEILYVGKHSLQIENRPWMTKYCCCWNM